MKILYDNLISTASVAESSYTTAFPVTNLFRLATTDEWRSAPLSNTATITMDLGSAKDVDFVGVLGNCYTRILPATTITLEGHSTSGFAAVAATGVLTAGAGEVAITAVTAGTAGNSITITLVNEAPAGFEEVDVVGNDIQVGMESGVTTAAQLVTALEASAPAMALISVSVATSGVMTAPDAVTLSGGVDGPFSQSVTVVSEEALAFASFASKTYRYWRLSFSNPSGTYTGCSAIYIGESFQFTDNGFDLDISLAETDLSSVVFSGTGRRFIDVQSVRVKALELSVNTMNKTEAGEWRAFTNTVGKHKPFFLMVDDACDVLTSTKVLSGQFMFDSSPTLSQEALGLWSSQFSVTEVI